MAISFETLRRLQEDEEKNKYTLQKIDDKFYGHIRDYLYEIDETYSDEEKENIEKVIKKLFKLRLEKLIKIARLSLNTQMSVENSTLPEKKFIENIKTVILDYQKEIDKKTNPLKIRDSKTNKDFVKVKFNTDVFTFVMEDMKTYGPYKKNEEHIVPKNVATLLLKNKKIVISG
ncbi:MAG: DNA replication complex GINS family protein [Candidatus Aenigmarchaeota archaeon]|nr:DNA replication complex GINS family protein [Candidatus Aenigmarchaeota archaeon]